MISTGFAVAQNLFGVLAFSFFLLPPGFLVAHLGDLNSFRSRSTPEKLLWSVALGTPLALILSDLLGRTLSPHHVIFCFLAMAAIALATALFQLRRFTPVQDPGPSSRTLRWALLLAALLALYPSLAVTDIQVGNRLFISTVMSDWAVRVPLVNAAMHGGVPPMNPLSDLENHIYPLRYYYFWYVLCARVAQLAHIPARAALTASCTWSLYGLLSIFFLALKYLLGIREHLRRKCLLGALLGSILGLDILFIVLQFLSPHLYPTPEMEWWREDRTASFLGASLYAPHHIAGVVCCFVAFLLLACLVDRKVTILRGVLYAAVVGACFAAAAGTSTFIAFIFVVVCLVWAVDLIRTRRWHMIAILAACGIIALALTHPFLHELGSGTSATGHAFAVLRWRSMHYVKVHLAHNHIQLDHGIRYLLLVQALVVVLDVFEFGFFLFVLIHRIRRDFLSGRTLTSGERATWVLLIGFALPAFFLSSATVLDSSANDLGIHAGILLRFVLLLMATPWVYSLWQKRHKLRQVPVAHKFFLLTAAVTALLGVTAQIYQVVMERLYFPVMEAQLIHKRMDIMTKDRLSYRLFNIRSSYRALDPVLPPDAVVQFNPNGRILPGFALYSNRQIAVYDNGCGTAFGGDLSACPPVFRGLLFLYGMAADNTYNPEIAFNDRGTTDPYVQPAATVAKNTDFLAACQQLSLSAILVESTDPIWSRGDSWVWTQQPFSATDTARSFLCPPRPGPKTP